MPLICACGCEKPLEPKPWHSYKHPQFLRGHHLGPKVEAFKARAAELPEPPASCACGCGQPIPYSPKHKYRVPKFINGHNLGAARQVNQTVLRDRKPAPLPCACGCGGLAAVNGRRQRRYIPGHAAKSQKRGPESPNWKGGRLLDSNGYVLIYRPEHPSADRRGYVAEHRLVCEGRVGRPLTTDEHVHHINGIEDDNRPENLVVLSRSEHMKAHGRNPNGYSTKEQRQEAGRKGAAARWGKA